MVTLNWWVGGGPWHSGDAVVTTADQVTLGWSASNATGCTGSGPDFTTSGTASGTDHFILEPELNASTTFSISCVGGGFTATDSLIMTTALGPAATLERQINGGYWRSANATIIGLSLIHI